MGVLQRHVGLKPRPTFEMHNFVGRSLGRQMHCFNGRFTTPCRAEAATYTYEVWVSLILTSPCRAEASTYIWESA